MPRASVLDFRLRVTAGAAMLLGLAGCASGPAPEREVAAAEVAVEGAEEANAAARAPAPYALARDKLERAREAMGEGENEEARRLAEEALVDADLAEARARSQVAQENAAELRASIETLREELDRGIARSS
jgi:Domain of unknown function (DUF4398)